MTRTPNNERIRRSRDRHREAGGVVTSIRLSPEAEAAVRHIIAAGHAKNRREAVEWSLLEAGHQVTRLGDSRGGRDAV